MDYSHESRDRQEKIRKLKHAGVIVYANNYRGKQDITQVRSQETRVKNVDDLMEN